MKKNLFTPIRSLAVMSALLICASLTSCSDSDDNPAIDTSQPAITEGAQDVLYGQLFYPIDADSLDNYRLPVASLRDVELEAYDHSDYYGVRVEERDGERYLAPYLKQEARPGIEVIRIRVTPKQRPDEARNAAIVVYKRRSESLARAAEGTTRAGGGLTSNYSDVIGRTTTPDAALNSQRQTLFHMTRLKDIATLRDDNFQFWTYDSEDYVTVNTTNSRVVDFTYDNQSVDQVTKSFNWGIGLGTLFRAAKVMFNIGFNFGQHKTEFSSSAYEYMLAMRRVEKATVKLDMQKFEADDGLSGDLTRAHHYKVLFTLLNKDFLAHLLNSQMNPEAVYNYWGTDMISEGTFGGLYTYLYGRQENACGTTTGTDAGFNVGVKWGMTRPDSSLVTTAQVLLWKFVNANPQNASASFNWSNEDSEYHEASKAFSVDFFWGGGNVSTDKEWEGGFNSQDNWALVSYSANAMNQKEADLQTGANGENSTLYPLHKVAEAILTGYKATFFGKAMSPKDELLIQLMEHNIQKLADAREDYIWALAADYEEQPYVLADFMMVTGSDKHEEGEPKPIIREDPFGVKRIYYPMMANDYAPVDHGYALETAQPKLKTKTYIEDNNTNKTQYWYYALAPKNETPGICHIALLEDRGEYPGWYHDNTYRDYVRRGESTHEGVKWDIDDNYVYVSYLEYYERFYERYQPITAVCFKTVNGSKVYRVASTGGAELAPGGSLQKDVYDEWTHFHYSTEDCTIFSNSHYDAKNQTGLNLKLYYTTDPLHINSIKEIHQPKKWGE